MGNRVSVNSYAYTHFGTREAEDKLSSKYEGQSGVQKLSVAFDYDSLPAADAADQAVLLIPANSLVKSAVLKVVDAWVGGTDLTSGTDTDPDGFHAAILTAALTAGSIHDGAGALVGASSGAGAEPVVVATTGSYTAGSAVLEVEYEPIYDRK